MVGAFDHQTCVLHVADDIVAQVAEVIDGGYGEIAAFVLDLVAPVSAVLHATGVPSSRLGVDVVVGGVGGGVEADVIKDIELGLGGEEGGFRDAGGNQVCLGLAGDVARVAGVGFLREGVVDEEVDVEGPRPAERIDESAGRVREQRHVRFVDLLETSDRGTVETQAFGENLRAEGAGRDGEVLHHTRQVAEAAVDSLDALLLDESQELLGACEHEPSS